MYIQYRHGLWKAALVDLDIWVGHVLVNEEFFEFCDYFYSCLQKKLMKEKNSKNIWVGHVLVDEEFFEFCDYFYSCLQKKLMKEKNSKNETAIMHC